MSTLRQGLIQVSFDGNKAAFTIDVNNKHNVITAVSGLLGYLEREYDLEEDDVLSLLLEVKKQKPPPRPHSLPQS